MDWVSAKEFVEAIPMRDRHSWIEVVKRRAAEGLIRCRAAAVIVGGARLDGATPDVPVRMWRNFYLRQNWISGDFETDANPLADNYVPIKAFGVQFYRGDLECAGYPSVDAAAAPKTDPPRERYQRAPNAQQKRLAKFFEVVDGDDDRPVASWRQEVLHGKYVEWNRKQTGRAIEPLSLTAFKAWLRRWRTGGRW